MTDPVSIERFRYLRMQLSSISKKRPMRSVMSQVFKHAQRHELILAAIGPDGHLTNPVLLARGE